MLSYKVRVFKYGPPVVQYKDLVAAKNRPRNEGGSADTQHGYSFISLEVKAVSVEIRSISTAAKNGGSRGDLFRPY